MKRTFCQAVLLTASGLALALGSIAATAQSGTSSESARTAYPANVISLENSAAASIVPDAKRGTEDAMPSWFEGGRLAADTQNALETLMDAAAHGLEPGDYGAAALAQDFHQAARQPADPLQMSRLDQALTDALTTYLHDLHQGRLRAEVLSQRFGIRARADFDARALIRQARQAHRLAKALQDAAPQAPQYQPLRQAMNTYRAMGQPTAWQTPLPAPEGRALRAGDAYAALPILLDRLRLLGDLGDLPANAVPTRYEGVLVEAVRRFQARHGLEMDGVIGSLTLAQLNISPDRRVRQMVLTLERMRWQPWPRDTRLIEVNIPEFMLHAHVMGEQGPRQAFSMRVIVGKSGSTRTPLLQEDMRFIEFSPYWNVPSSIACSETLPKLRRDPGYLSRQGFEFVTPDGTTVQTSSREAIEAVQRGDWRIRQRPGPHNALGDIKFVFPNPRNIFLHHTSTPELFERARRDFSHGCIRIEAPVQLARFVLEADPEWTEARIIQAMTSGRSQTMPLPAPVPVVMSYRTATVQNDGTVNFLPDIYQQDAGLAQALHLP